MSTSQPDFEQARFNMIEQQVRTWEVLDQRVLDTMSAIPRENFVPEQYRSLAFADIEIPVGNGQVMMAPKVEGRLLQALHLAPEDSVFEIGTGSGYLTARLASLAGHVTSVDIFADFTTAVASRLESQGITNASLDTADAANEIGTDQQYDAIAVTGSVPLLQMQFHENLKIGGRLFVITGGLPIMETLLITRVDADNWSREVLFETCIPPLEHAAKPQGFVF